MEDKKMDIMRELSLEEMDKVSGGVEGFDEGYPENLITDVSPKSRGRVREVVRSTEAACDVRVRSCPGSNYLVGERAGYESTIP